LPSRLIDVSHGDTLRLYCPTIAAPDELIRYAALSYVWGSDPQPFTTTLTLPARISPSGFPLSSLPQTLQNGVCVPQELGIPYLWVNALCIVQDDIADKNAEVGKMSAIYQGALVTIIADDRKGGLWTAVVLAGDPQAKELVVAKLPAGQRAQQWVQQWVQQWESIDVCDVCGGGKRSGDVCRLQGG
ncbi:heterokaryon incompatibility protein-domain-containing protein, partial [Achaetomium macrosporum]